MNRKSTRLSGKTQHTRTKYESKNYYADLEDADDGDLKRRERAGGRRGETKGPDNMAGVTSEEKADTAKATGVHKSNSAQNNVENICVTSSYAAKNMIFPQQRKYKVSISPFLPCNRCTIHCCLSVCVYNSCSASSNRCNS